MVDYSNKMNKELIEQSRVQIIEGTVERMSFPNDYFNLVTACETYYFWSSFSDALKEIKRVLKPCGRLLLVNEMIKDAVFEVETAKLIEETHVCLFPLEEIKNVMQSVGFVGVKIFTTDQSPWNAILVRSLPDKCIK